MNTPTVVAIALASGLVSTEAQQSVDRNPSFLHAVELLRRADPGVAPRVRFEWEHVPRAQSYVLSGRWTDTRTWAVRATEYRVTARNATTWNDQRVTFDVSLPAGSHSWKVVAVFGKDESGDFANPAQVTFSLREEER